MVSFIRHYFRRLFTISTTICTESVDYLLQTEGQNQSLQLTKIPEAILFNTQLKQFVKFGSLHDARQLFDNMPQRDEVSWTTLISGYVNAADYSEALGLFSCMMLDPSLKMDPFMLSLALKACGLHDHISYGKSLHTLSVKTGLVNSVFVGSALLDMYTKIGKILEGCQVFDEMPVRNVVSWTAIITGLVKSGFFKMGLLYFSEFCRSNLQFDSYILAIALKACADSSDLNHGREIHLQAIMKGFVSSSFVENTLATMYNKCGKLDYGLCLFRKMRNPDVVSWTTIISTYIHIGKENLAIQEFMRMRESNAIPNEYTFATVIIGCANTDMIRLGEQMHAHVTRLGFVSAFSVANSLMAMYSKCGQLDAALMIFDKVTRKDIVSWSTIIAGFCQAGSAEEAFRLLSRMRREGPRPTEFAFGGILSVCGYMAILEQGRQLHAYVLKIGFENTPMVRSALINMYSKCGSIMEASDIFDDLSTDDIVSWTAMINGYAEHGHSQEAIALFEKLPQMNLIPDSVTFIGVLTACSHAGLVDIGYHYFDSMRKKYGIIPAKEHYGCMIDLLCRAGRLTEAECMISTMPYEKDDVVWSIFLRACRISGDFDRGRHAAEKILELNPNCAGTHITLANIFSVKGKWREAAELRQLMKLKGVIKEPGSSWVKVKDQISTFVSGDTSHPDGQLIYGVLDLLASATDEALRDFADLLYYD